MTASVLESTISRLGERVGEQQPRVCRVPAFASDRIGVEVIDFMASIGKPVLPWQADVIRGSFATRADGKWAAYEVTVLKARQNGKGVITEAQELGGLYLLKEQKIVHSAHLFDTSREAFDRLVELIDGSDWLRTRTNKVNQAHGKEGIELTRSAGGGKLKFKARTLHGTRGFSGDRIILDEAYGLTVGQHQAISPILATLPNPQITYTSSPPDEKTGPMPEDAILPSIRQRGTDGDPQMAFYEWSPGDEYSVDDVDEWYRCNASLGYLIEEEYLHRQHRIFVSAGKPHAFATEHLGAWPKAAAEQWRVVSETQWKDAEDVAFDRPAKVVFAVAVNYTRTKACIGLAGPRPDGDLHIEVADHRDGTGWIVRRAVEINDKWKPAAWVVDPGGPAGSLIPDLEAAGLTVTLMNTRNVAQAFGSVYDGLTRRPGETVEVEGEEPTPVRRVRHRIDEPLTTAMAAAETRKSGQGKTWDEPPGGDATPLHSVSAALWGFLTLPEPEYMPAPQTANNAPTGPQGNFWRNTQRLSL